MQGLKKILSSSFSNRTTLRKQVEAGLIVEYVNQLICEFWGKKGQEQAKAKFIKNKILTILTANSAIAQEIKFKQNKIKDLVNDKYKNRVINQLKIIPGGFDKEDKIS